MHPAGKKKKIILGAVILAFVLLAAAYWPKKPFADLSQDDVSSVDVSFGKYPNYQISESDQETIVNGLKSITITGKSYLYRQIDYSLDKGTYVEIFIVHLKTGKDVKVVPCYPFIIIDDTVYHCKDRDTLEKMVDIFTSYIDVIRQTSQPITSN